MCITIMDRKYKRQIEDWLIDRDCLKKNHLLRMNILLKYRLAFKVLKNDRKIVRQKYKI